MKKEATVSSLPDSPKWKLVIDGELYFMGIGNPLTDFVYSSILIETLHSMIADFEVVMERPQFKVEKPVMIRLDQGDVGDKLIVLKPGYVEKQEAVGAVLEFLLKRAQE